MSISTSEVSRLRALLAVAQKALSTCQMSYSEFNQFEGSWEQTFSKKEVHEALRELNEELGLPAPKRFPRD